MTSHNGFFLIFSKINYFKFNLREARVFFNKLVQTVCVEVSFQIYRLYRSFPLFYGEVMQPTKKIWPYSSSATQNQHESIFVFRFTRIFILTVIFAILVGHIELKNLKENAGLQSHTMPIAEEHDMSIWIKFLKKIRRESAAKEITEKAVMTSLNLKK